MTKWLCYPKKSTNLMQFLSNYQWHSPQNYNKKFYKTLSSQSNLEKEKWTWRNQPSWLKTMLQSYSHQDSMVLTKKINIDQWNKIQGPQIKPGTHGHLIFDKEGKNIQWRKHIFFNNWCWENWTVMCRRMKLEHFLTPYTIINSKSIKGLNVWLEAINF